MGFDGSAVEMAEEIVFEQESVEAVGELPEIRCEMLVADAVEGASQPGIEVGDDGMGPGEDSGANRIGRFS